MGRGRHIWLQINMLGQERSTDNDDDNHLTHHQQGLPGIELSPGFSQSMQVARDQKSGSE